MMTVIVVLVAILACCRAIICTRMNARSMYISRLLSFLTDAANMSAGAASWRDGTCTTGTSQILVFRNQNQEWFPVFCCYRAVQNHNHSETGAAVMADRLGQ